MLAQGGDYASQLYVRDPVADHCVLPVPQHVVNGLVERPDVGVVQQTVRLKLNAEELLLYFAVLGLKVDKRS